ncbi:MAG TPA: hypothetical protein VGM27_04875 [Acidobacteriaceae bacterium]|jgi:hypothetical protein
MNPPSTAIVLDPAASSGSTLEGSFVRLKEMVLASVQSEHSRQNYAKSLDEVWTFFQETAGGILAAVVDGD